MKGEEDITFDLGTLQQCLRYAPRSVLTVIVLKKYPRDQCRNIHRLVFQKKNKCSFVARNVPIAAGNSRPS
jgi:hypothetical protein